METLSFLLKMWTPTNSPYSLLRRIYAGWQRQRSSILKVDGTFQICPLIFYQVFTVHACVHGVHVPLAYCLLPNKRQETYERVFLLLELKIRELDLEIVPTAIVSDFELAIMQATTAVFPVVQTKGCYFHFCQALIRKL